MKLRKVGKEVLFDYIGMNPAFAKLIGFKGIVNDEVLVLDGMVEEKTKTTFAHEVEENKLLESGMGYWDAHIKLLKENEGYKSLEVKSMESMIRKTVTCEIKEIEDRTLEFVGSTEEPDRVGDIVHTAGWKLDNYLKNPVFMWAHDYKAPPIGKAMRVWPDGGKLLFRIQFAPKETYEFADTCYKLYKGGFLNAVSVGFSPDEKSTKAIEGGGSEYNSQELLELSAVPIPACSDALISARSKGVITTKEFEIVTKPEETEDYIRIPVKDCKVTATIDISEKEGIKALYCGDEKEIATYLFAKAKGWTMEKARKWVTEHKKPKNISQAEIKDEIDYLEAMIDEAGISDDTKLAFLELTRRISGNDIPVDIITIERLEKLFNESKDKFGGT